MFTFVAGRITGMLKSSKLVAGLMTGTSSMLLNLASASAKLVAGLITGTLLLTLDTLILILFGSSKCEAGLMIGASLLLSNWIRICLGSGKK